MLSARVLAALAVAVVAAEPPTPLQVLSSSPAVEASLTARIQVIFDRPVAGSLDRTVDPALILSIDPRIPGRAEWRDPVTLRFLPASPLKPGQSYTVTVANSFEAMDGSRLEKPYSFTFAVTGPQLLAGLPVSANEHPSWLTPKATFDLVFGAELDRNVLRGLAYLDLNQNCSNPGVIKLNPTGQRPIGEKDPWQYREAGGWERDRAADAYRRVVTLVPERPLPLGCSGELVVPTVIDPEGTKPFARWSFSTYGKFLLTRADCAGDSTNCPTGGIRVYFTNPVKGSELQRHLTVLPRVDFTIADTAQESSEWYLEAQLTTHTAYAVIADSGIRDVFGQPLTGNPAAGFKTTGYAPLVEHEYGRMTVERAGFGTLAVKHVNVDTLIVTTAPVPDALISGILQYSRWNRDDSVLARVLKGAVSRTVAVPGPRDRVRIYGVKLPVYNAQRTGSPVLQLVKVTSPTLSPEWQQNQPFAIVQVTDLAVHAKIGISEGVVWVTGATDGKARAGAQVTLFDSRGRIRASARTGLDGTTYLTGFKADTAQPEYGFEGYVIARLGNDRAITSISSYDPDLSPWRFNVRSGYGTQRHPVAAAVFTERGIYRPGEPLYAKSIVRAGNLGALSVPARSDSIHWVFNDREGGILKEVTTVPSAFGTADQMLELPADLPLGTYGLSVEQRRAGRWVTLASTYYRVAEYRPPEFLVTTTSDSVPRFPGDSATAQVEARYLFGAPMARAAMTWVARQTSMDFWSLAIPGTDGFYFGENGYWWEEEYRSPGTQVIGQGVDTLDGTGRSSIRVGLVAPEKGRPARATIEASVTDVNRQVVGSATSFVVHPSSFYVGAKPLGASYFWLAGKPQSVALIAVRPAGDRVAGVRVTGTIVRQEWHRVHRTRGGYSEVYGEWVADTVGTCKVVTLSGNTPAECRFTPPSGGSYILGFTAEDEKGRPVSTTVYRWATGSDWVPWSDETQFKMDVIPDKTRYSVGDTASVMFASPFTDQEAWITVEREGLIEQRRMKLASGSTTLKFPVVESWAPNVFVSIVVARGRSQKPGPLDDPGRPTIRVGYAELRVTPEVKRLTVSLKPLQLEYRPGDTARVDLKVVDRKGVGQRSEVTLWAVDEGVLALTGYRTPDPIDLLYAPRGLGLRLSSNMTTVAPQVPEGEKGRSPGGGGGGGEADVFRSQFKTTAFFLGSVVTDSNGAVIASAKLPDNLTTFRVMAVAVTAGDRYGNGESPMLVTRPLLARPALPRFLREGDSFSAGVVVNQRAGGTPTVRVEASAQGAQLRGAPTISARLEAGRGREVRFDFRQPGQGPLGSSDSSAFRFKVTGAGDADAVEKRLGVKPAYRPRAWTVAGVLADTATAILVLPEGIDPDRSRLQLSLGASPLSIIQGVSWQLRVYPYYCTEQTSSAAQPIIALYRAQRALKGVTLIPGDPRRDIELAVSLLSRRQRPDGGIGYWSSTDWTTPWLSSYAGLTLLEARSVGVAVDDSVLARLANYLRNGLKNPQGVRAPVITWYQQVQAQLSDQVAAADFLSRYGKPELPAENELLRNAAQLSWEDRVRLAEMLARRRAVQAARALLQPAWSAVKVDGRRAVLPEEALTWHHYFYSRLRPTARLLVATLAVDSVHPLLGPLVETLVQQGRAGLAIDPWNTQDYAATVSALVAFDRVVSGGAARSFSVSSGGKTLFTRAGGLTPGSAPAGPGRPAPRPVAPIADSVLPLTGLVTDLGGGKQGLRFSINALGSGSPIYYYLTVSEVPKQRPVNPEDQGIKLERWYEKYDTPAPIVSVAAGQLVRVRLRITVPTDRQFVVVDDALPAGLEAVDLSLRTASLAPGPGVDEKSPHLAPEEAEDEGGEGNAGSGFVSWYYGYWDSGWWSPFDHKEMADARVLYSATLLWKGTYTMTYIARATTPGVFVRPPAHAEEMYNPAVYGRSDGGVFTVTDR